MAIRRTDVPEGAHWLSITVGALLSIVLGVLLAGLTRALTPPQRVDELPETPEAGVVYYIEPSSPGILPEGWRQRWDTLLAGEPGTYEFTSDEVALISELAFDLPEEDPAGPLVIIPGTLHATLAEAGPLVSTEGTLRVFGIDVPLVVQAEVGFAAEGDAIAVVPRRLLFNSLDAPDLFGLRTRLFNVLRQAYVLSEASQAALAKVNSVVTTPESISVEVPR